MATFGGKMDQKDIWKLCPFNANHKVSSRRYQHHVATCGSRSQATSDLRKCTFNAGHLVMEDKMELHLQQCPDAKLYLREKVEASQRQKEFGGVFLYPKPEGSEEQDNRMVSLPEEDSWEVSGADDNRPKPGILRALADPEEAVALFRKMGDRHMDPMLLSCLTKAQRKGNNDRIAERIREVEENKARTSASDSEIPAPAAQAENPFRLPATPATFAGIGRGRATLTESPRNPGMGFGRGLQRK